MALTIYGIFASRAVRPLWTAEELGLPYHHVPTPYQGGATRTPEFLALNPNGHIPVLVDERPEGRVVVWESMACALYLARHHGKGDGSDIAPATPAEDAEALRWALWSVTELEADARCVLMHRLGLPPERRDADKLAALAAQAAERGLHLAPEIINWMLTHHERDIRKLAALLDALDRYSLATGRPITLPLLRAMLADPDSQRP